MPNSWVRAWGVPKAAQRPVGTGTRMSQATFLRPQDLITRLQSALTGEIGHVVFLVGSGVTLTALFAAWMGRGIMRREFGRFEVRPWISAKRAVM